MSPKKIERIHTLWDELVDFDASKSDAAVDHLMDTLSRMVNAKNAHWIGAVRMESNGHDPLKGWRVPVVRQLHPAAPHPDEELYKEMQRLWERREVDPSYLVAVKNAGKFRQHSLRGTLPPEWFKSDFYKHFHASLGNYDTVYTGFPLNRDAESHFGFHRQNSRKAFTAEEMELIAYALRGIKWFHHQIMLSHGLLLASAPLIPSERKVLQQLLTDAPEKEIAHRLGLTTATTHQYVTGLFRKFGVNGRAGLMSLWLRSQG